MDIPLLAFANGANDVSKAIATLVGSGVTDYRSAIAWGTVWTVIGAAVATFVARAMVNTFGHGVLRSGTIIEPAATLAVLTGAMAWVLFASRTGLPVSTTHALTGAIVGTGFVAFAEEGLIWSAIGKKIVLVYGHLGQCIGRIPVRQIAPDKHHSGARGCGQDDAPAMY
jgi:PiT family inorganic phosphate transporter